MTHFHEGQEVEVEDIRFSYHEWRKAKIVRANSDCAEVQFPNSTRAVLDVAHIRAIEDPLETAARYLNHGGTIEGERQ